jgi:hypothetical protein
LDVNVDISPACSSLNDEKELQIYSAKIADVLHRYLAKHSNTLLWLFSYYFAGVYVDASHFLGKIYALFQENFVSIYKLI